MKNKGKRIKKFEVLLTEEEHSKLRSDLKRSAIRSMSDYIRHALFGKRILMNIRNQSQDELMLELIALKKMLHSAAIDFSRRISQAGPAAHHPASEQHLARLEQQGKQLLQLTGEINLTIAKVGELWLQ